MIEPVTLTATATAIATLIGNEALRKGGEKIGESAYNKIAQLLNFIREKFKAEGVEGKLTKAQEEPSEKNKNRLEGELREQMEDDDAFAEKLRELLLELKSDEQVNQVFFKGVDVKGDAEAGDVEQIITRSGSVSQEAVTDVKVGRNLKIGNVKQQS